MTNEISIELDGVAEQLKDARGVWRSCSGCHEHNEGVAQGPWSYVFECNLGMGCHECGGLGAVWDNVDYSGYGEPVEPVLSIGEQEIKALLYGKPTHEFSMAIGKLASWLAENGSDAAPSPAAPASAAEPVDPFIVKERDLLRQAIVRYCDHTRMGTVEPPELQQVIDDAFASREVTP